VWAAQEAPLPGNAATGPIQQGTTTIFSNAQLNAVDCSAPGACVAGGGYTDTSGNFDAVFVTLQSGVWTALEAPIPSDSDPAGTLAAITGVSCPAADACVADGYYWVNYNAQIESGMLLTQSTAGWTVTSAPVPVTGNVSTASHAAHGKTALQGVSCAKRTSFCRAVGSRGKRALIEKMWKR